jgi:hypothetical protein
MWNNFKRTLASDNFWMIFYIALAIMGLPNAAMLFVTKQIWAGFGQLLVSFLCLFISSVFYNAPVESEEQQDDDDEPIENPLT